MSPQNMVLKAKTAYEDLISKEIEDEIGRANLNENGDKRVFMGADPNESGTNKLFVVVTIPDGFDKSHRYERTQPSRF